MIRFGCPTCKSVLEAPDHRAAGTINCPKCGQRLQIPAARASSGNRTMLGNLMPTREPAPWLVGAPPPLPQRAPAPPPLPALDSLPGRPPFLASASRVLSLPWLILIFSFGFLPWSRVSCVSKDFSWQLSQSGYQTVYGGVSSPFDVLEAAKDSALKQMKSSKEALNKALEIERSDFLMACSPFMVVFWISVLTAVVCVRMLPLGALRLKVFLTLAGLMGAMLILTLALDTPLERQIARGVHEEIRKDPQSTLMMTSGLASGKTLWFWLTFVAVLSIGATETVTNLVWNTSASVRGVVLAGLAAGTVFLIIAGVSTQFMLWEKGLTALESRLAQLNRIEQEKAQREEERRLREEQERQRQRQQAEVDWQRQKRQAEEARQERERDAEKVRERTRQAYEARQKALEQQQQQLRLDQARREEERRRRAAELADKRAREAERKQHEEIKNEAERKADLERRGLPYYPKPSRLYEGKNAEEWYNVAKASPFNGAIQQQAADALRALKDQGMPFLMRELENATPAGAGFVLNHIQPEYLHANDALRIVGCLDKKRGYYLETRLRALQCLRMRKESKRHIKQIEELVTDLLTSRRYKAEVKDKVNELLEAIKAK